MTARVNFLSVVIGTIGTGKTTFVLNTLKDTEVKKYLVIDTIDHPSYRHLSFIPPAKIKLWQNGGYRTYSEDVQGLLEQIASYMNNCTLVFEDATNYFSYKALKPLERKLLVHRKQVNVDIIMIFHDWGYVPPDVFRLCNTITLFRTMESPNSRKNYLPNYKNIQETWERVQAKAKTNPYYNETIVMQ